MSDPSELHGTLAHVCISRKKGRGKHPVDSAELIAGHGIRDDAHAGDWHRQISLLTVQDIDTVRAEGLDLHPGSFGENLALEGFDLARIGIGSILAIKSARLEITQIGKVCHDRCAIYHKAGDCVMPRAGVFARVLEGGTIEPGCEVRVVDLVPRERIQAAVVTVSDRCSRGETTDTAGPAVASLLTDKLQTHVAWTGIVPDDHDRIADTLRDLSGRGLDIVCTAGGTGFAERDVTPEATRSVVEREAPGLSEEMRRRSREITPHALLQRGVCGIRGHTLIVNLPGSEKGARENLEFILEALPHAVQHLRNQPAHEERERAHARHSTSAD